MFKGFEMSHSVYPLQNFLLSKYLLSEWKIQRFTCIIYNNVI